MSSIPLVALSVRPQEYQDPIATQQKLVGLKALGQQVQQQAALAPGQVQQQQQAIQSGQQGLQAGALQLQQQQKAADDQAKIQKIFEDSGDDVKSAIPKIMAVNPQAGMQFQKSILDSQTADLNQKKAIIQYHNESAGRLAQLAGGVTDEPSFHTAIGQALSENLIDGPTAAQYLSQPFNQDEVKEIQQKALSAKDQLDLADKKLTADANAQKDKDTAANQLETQKPPDVRDYEYAQKQGYKGTFEQWKEKFKTGMLPDGSALTDTALDQAATRYRETGVMPSFGMGAAGAATRMKVMNRAGAQDSTANIGSNSAEFKANQDSLKNLQGNFDQVTAFENTAGKNLDQFLSVANKVADSGSPWVNKPLRSLDQSALGSADQAAFNAARQTALTEIAKVLNSSNASGVLSDSARSEVGDLIGPNATLKQIVSAANILKTDMANRHQAYQDQIGDIKKRLGGAQGGGPSQAGAPAASPTATSADPFAQFGGKRH